MMQDLVAALEACKARQLHLNPVTTAATAKCLSGIAVAEARELAPAEAKQLAMASAGDLRNAVAMLQMLLCGTAPVSQTKGSKVCVGYVCRITIQHRLLWHDVVSFKTRCVTKLLA